MNERHETATTSCTWFMKRKSGNICTNVKQDRVEKKAQEALLASPDVHLARMDLEDLSTCILVWMRELDFAVQPPRTHERRVKCISSVGCGNDLHHTKRRCISADRHGDKNFPGVERRVQCISSVGGGNDLQHTKRRCLSADRHGGQNLPGGDASNENGCEHAWLTMEQCHLVVLLYLTSKCPATP